MSSLKEENARLKAENEKLEERLNQLKKENCNLRNYHNNIIQLKTIKYSEEGRPTLCINNFRVYFESSDNKAAQLAKIIFRPEIMMELKYKPISTEEIYELYQYTEDWFDISSKERKDFNQRTYQAFRLLNNKLAPHLGQEKLFKKEDGKYAFSKLFRIVC